MPRLLIICDDFHPPAFLPRVRFFCDYLKKQGWHLTLVTEDVGFADKHPFVAADEVIEIPYYCRNRFKRVDWSVKNLLNLFVDYKSRYFFRKARRLLRGKTFDAVYSTAFYAFPMPAAARLAKEFALPLLCDMRDAIEQSPQGTFFAHRPPRLFGRQLTAYYETRAIRRRNRALAAADCVTTISPWHVALFKHVNPNTHLLYNGFDPDLFVAKQTKTDRFQIVYTGRINNTTTRNPALLFEALQRFKQSGTMPQELVVAWYLDAKDRAIVSELAARYGVVERMEYHDYTACEHIPNILHQSSILLILTNKSSEFGVHGIMTTKFFEAIGVDKPVLCVRSDEDVLSAAIDKAQNGCAAQTVEEVESFITEQYRIWRTEGYTAANLTPQMRLSYSRTEQAKLFEQLLTNIIEKHAN